ncbi:MAG TPA: hypothetical protein ENJ37_00185 [Deltaproteobacteria bacterium]|nr:hypothetical protein [Deltaproteobacteria bacterium]
MAVIGFFIAGANEHPSSVKPDCFGLCFAWLESPVAARLDLTDNVSWSIPDIWPQGRIFGENGEYRWRKKSDGKLHCVLILDDGKMPDEFGGELELEKTGDAGLILWGEPVDPAGDPEGGVGMVVFHDNTIPGYLKYPITWGKVGQHAKAAPCLTVRRYRGRNGSGEFERCLAVKMEIFGGEEGG